MSRYNQWSVYAVSGFIDLKFAETMLILSEIIKKSDLYVIIDTELPKSHMKCL